MNSLEIKEEIDSDECNLIIDSDNEEKCVVKIEIEYKEEIHENILENSSAHNVIDEEKVKDKLNVETIYKCDNCDYTSDLFCNYQAHFNICICKPATKTKPKRRRKYEKSFKCEICAKTLNAASTKAHMKMHTDSQVPLDCDICHKSFRRAQDRTKHMEKHTEEQPYQCNICPETFSLASRLKTHMRLHRKAFKCEVCMKVFNRASELEEHSEVHEKNEFVCELCGRVFARPYYRKVHMRLHTGKGVFACDICEIVFPLGSLLRQHYQTRKHQKKIAETEMSTN